jgi:phytoene dehydrogenase-like protein
VSPGTDAIVIGSGPNGLAAAIRLARADRQVLVLEASDRPGGAVRTEELTLPGFKHDTFSAVYPAAAASRVFASMPLADHGLRWVHPEACSAHPLPGGRAAVLFRDLDATAESLDALHRGDGRSWARFVGPYLESFEAVRATMLSGFPPVAGPFELTGSAGPLRALAFATMLPTSTVRLGRRLFKDEGSRAWLYGAAMHGDTPPHSPGGAIFSFYLNLLGHAVGWPSPKGGAGNLAVALVGYLESLGGEVRTSARVERILSANGRVTGVGIVGGEQLSASVVIADVMPDALVRLTGDALAPSYRRALGAYRYGPATIKVDWALDGPIPWSNAAVGGAGTVHVGGDEQQLLASVAAAEKGLPEDPFLVLGQQSVADASRAPAGKHTAWAYTHGPARGVDYACEQDRHVERMEAKVEQFAPGFRDRILARHVQGPAQLEAANANLVGGDVGGGSYSLRQMLFRPVAATSPYRTSLDGLFIGSAATFPGGAVHGIPGDAAARAALSSRSASSEGMFARAQGLLSSASPPHT